MDPKNADRSRCIGVLRRVTLTQRLAKALELPDLGKRLFLQRLRRRFSYDDE